MKCRGLCALGLCLALALAGCGRDVRRQAEQDTGLQLAGAQLEENYDTHGGNGDGVSCAVFAFAGDGPLQQIRGSGWTALPPDETVAALLYGRQDGGGRIGPFLCRTDGTPLVPMVESGYYRLTDRQSGAAAGAALLERASLNCTVAVYDADTARLYVCRLDS